MRLLGAFSIEITVGSAECLGRVHRVVLIEAGATDMLPRLEHGGGCCCGSGTTSMLRLVVAVRVVAPAGGPARAIDLLVAEGLVPLLQSIDTLPGLAIAFSAGVPFWEQLRQRHPTVASGLGSLIEAGRIEPLGGPAFDVVLAGVPRRDRIGQVAAQLD